MQHDRNSISCKGILLVTAFIAVLFGSLCVVVPAQCASKYLYDDLFGATFPDANNGWACGRWGSIFHTGDGGKTWVKQERATDYTLSSIHFVNENQGWAVGDEGVILHSNDGGKTWAKQNSPVDFFLMDVCFIDDSRGWIVTEQTTILYTEDGGSNWAIQFEDQDYILKSISFSDDRNGWAVGEYGYIYHTTDGGMTWENQAGFFDISDLDGHIVAGTFLFDVSAVDENTAWACGIDSYLIMTEDGGKTWKEIATGIPKTHFYAILADNPKEIFISGNGTFIYSSDSGTTWEQPAFTPPIIYTWLYDVVQASENTFVTVGREGVMYIGTKDTWTKVNY